MANASSASWSAAGESLLPQINIVLNWFDEVRQQVPK